MWREEGRSRFEWFVVTDRGRPVEGRSPQYAESLDGNQRQPGLATNAGHGTGRHDFGRPPCGRMPAPLRAHLVRARPDALKAGQAEGGTMKRRPKHKRSSRLLYRDGITADEIRRLVAEIGTEKVWDAIVSVTRRST